MADTEPQSWDNGLQGCAREGCGCIFGFITIIGVMLLFASLWTWWT